MTKEEMQRAREMYPQATAAIETLVSGIGDAVEAEANLLKAADELAKAVEKCPTYYLIQEVRDKLDAYYKATKGMQGGD